MLKLPFFTELEAAKNILIAGAGGGYDIFSGLPLYFGLQAAGKKVHLANLSFSFLPPHGNMLRLKLHMHRAVTVPKDDLCTAELFRSVAAPMFAALP